MSGPVVTLKVVQSDQTTAESSSIRTVKRAYLSPDVLRTYRLAAGEWVCLGAPSTDSARPIIAQLWPRAGIEDDGASCRSDGGSLQASLFPTVIC